MNEQADHPDIEKLPLEIDGIPVRETIREIFRNPENGTPDNISKAGCLALALKSNEMGGSDKGYVIWNAWRIAFPEKGDESLGLINVVDFSGLNFSKVYINYFGFEFGECANFFGSKFDDSVNFSSALFGDYANFKATLFSNWACFDSIEFGERADFEAAYFGSGVDFSRARFGDYANFKAAEFGAGSSFHAAQFGDGSVFELANFGIAAIFEGAQFAGSVCFDACTFDSGVDFRGQSWGEVAPGYEDNDLAKYAHDWAVVLGASPNIFKRISFRGAVFLGESDFSNRQFEDQTDFGILNIKYKKQFAVRDVSCKAKSNKDQDIIYDDCPDYRRQTIFHRSPKFYNCEFLYTINFDESIFPKATGNKEAEDTYRTLKLAFSKQQAIREEQRFFRLEMEEETLRETGMKRWLFKRYKQFSDYGFSITRPLKYGGLGVLGLTVVYGLLSWLGQCGLGVQACQFAPQWLEFSLLQTLPLPGLDKLSETASKAFWPAGSWWGLVLSALVIVHKTITLAALFLIGLALRNLFKLK